MPSVAARYIWFRRGVLLAWLLGTAALVYQVAIFPSLSGKGPNKDVVFFVAEEATLGELADALWEQQAILDRDLWLRFMRLRGASKPLRRGFVPINKALSAQELALRFFELGVTPVIKVNIPEGFTRWDVAERLFRFGITDRQAFVAHSERSTLLERLQVPAHSAEGYLFPATYELGLRAGPERAMERMVAAFRRMTRPLFEQLARARQAGETTLSDHEALILASIVEKEARVAEERPIIAGVFLNRLRDPTFVPHRLQADPTVGYGCLSGSLAPTCREFDGRRITSQMVRDPENAYNTYRIEGLPPGPICNPGIASLRAVVEPAAHDYFYFVATGGGRHTFSHSLDEHNSAIRGE
jgi:UPF0755 protein